MTNTNSPPPLRLSSPVRTSRWVAVTNLYSGLSVECAVNACVNTDKRRPLVSATQFFMQCTQFFTRVYLVMGSWALGIRRLTTVAYRR
jgi:hypothetical protein